jgi:3-oxoacyl-[acyl-carrier-protein] synthase II
MSVQGQSGGANRVVVTGIGLATPIGNDLAAVSDALRSGRHGIRPRPEWAAYDFLETRLAADVASLDLAKLPRKAARTMGRVSLLAAYATERALSEAGLDEEELGSGRVGLAYGSTHGSSSAMEEWCRSLFKNEGFQGLPGSTYLKFMSHTCAANLALHFGIRGRVATTCAACVSASQAIGYGYEMIKHGLEEVMVCGGAEELHYTHAGVFDIMYATSRAFNDSPDQSPRPFDARRDGLVIGEGAGTLVLESFERARTRGAHVWAEVLGYATNCDGTNVTSPSTKGMAEVMRLALKDARLSPDRVGYINAHATGTDIGDVCESQATNEVFGPNVAVSSTKSFTGHTLGACGSIETAACIAMMREGWLAPNRTLENVDPRCAPLDYIVNGPREARVPVVMNNNFAFGGINTSLILGLP